MIVSQIHFFSQSPCFTWPLTRIIIAISITFLIKKMSKFALTIYKQKGKQTYGASEISSQSLSLKLIKGKLTFLLSGICDRTAQMRSMSPLTPKML